VPPGLLSGELDSRSAASQVARQGAESSDAKPENSMQLLTQMRLAPRLAVAFGTLIVGAAAVVVFGISRLAALTDSLTLISADRVPKIEKLAIVTDNANLIAREVRNLLIWDDAAHGAEALKAIETARGDTVAAFKALDPTITTPDGRKLLDATLAARAAYVPAQDRVIAAVRGGKRDEARNLLGDEMRPAQLAYLKAIAALRSYQVDLVDLAVQEGQAAYERARAVMFTLLALMIAGGIGFAWLIARSIVDPLRRAVGSAGRIAAGDLTERIDAAGRDETADLLRAMSGMQDSLRKVVGEVRTGVDAFTTASAQIAAGNQDLSSRTEEQASSLQETASSMEQLTGTVTQTADNARQANQLAASASQAAGRGGEVVGQVVETMQQISASSQRIADIIGTIDGIAFQTNILALNAAVEAARAGEQGRGFAVVAGEVRSLAQRSAEAAKEIKRLITDSVEKVGAGSRLVDDAGQSMRDIVNQVRRVTDLVGEITSASEEQSSGIGQVNQAVAQMDQVTQQNAALVEESAAAAQSLSHQAQKLAEVVSVFRTGDGGSAPAAAPRHAPRAAATPKAAAPRAAAPRPAPAGRPSAKAEAVTAAGADDDWTTF
jgi:methyl-accepting chemotaxis protein